MTRGYRIHAVDTVVRAGVLGSEADRSRIDKDASKDH